MSSRHRSNASAESQCPKRRLAEGDVAVVDECDCGMVQLHLGALTLRLTKPAVASLLATLSEALAHAGEHDPPSRVSSSLPRGRA